MLPVNVSADGNALNLLPQSDGTDDALTDYAYALYTFTLPGYGDNAVLSTQWMQEPADYDVAWVAVADFDAQRWEIRSLPASNLLDLGDIDPYLDQEQFAVVVLLGGSSAAKLASIRIGTDQPPTPSISPDVSTGIYPLTVTFDASASTDMDGSIAKYEWDFTGDGTYELDSGTDPTVEHTFDTVGDYSARVRVTDNKGMTVTAATVISVAEAEWQHTIGAVGQAGRFSAVAIDAAGSVYACGETTQIVAGPTLIMLTKWAPDGSYQWGRTWTLVGSCTAHDVVVDADGNVIVVGSVGGTESVVLKWSPLGDLLWGRRYSIAGTDEFLTVCTDGSEIYAAGVRERFGFPGDLRDAMLWRIDGSGTGIWQRKYDWFEEDVAGVALLHEPAGPTAVYMLTTQSSINGFLPLYVRYTLSGDFEVDGYSLDAQCEALSLAVGYDPGLDTALVYILGTDSQGFALFGTDESFNPLFASLLDKDGAVAHDMLLAPDGRLLIGGMDNLRAGLWAADAQSGSFIESESFAGDEATEFFGIALGQGKMAGAGIGMLSGGNWQTESVAQSPLSATWGLGAGLSYTETPTLTNAPGTVSDWTAGVIDNSGNNAFVAQRGVL